ncbi:hypothetical protein [Aromatoleum toluclasticum]|uniref:hypothetical protein n=1 Tax=Aromatoleum toluclasticum TaxID=92003 RepID=UPI0003666CA3|nr:hypothetical protein [Aromatoleum toluclasticum]
MIRISVKHDLPQLATALKAHNRKVEVAAQRALLKTARIVKDIEQKEMAKVFDRPTRWTLNAFEVVIDKGEMSARVQVKDGYWHRADNYLNSQIVGGGRKDKAFELALRKRGLLPAGWYAVPGRKAALDAYGNMSVGQIKQVLSWFDSAEPYAGSTQNMGEKGRNKRRKGTRTKRGFEYFAAMPGRRVGGGSWKEGRRQNLKPGIYKRTSFSFVGTRGGRMSAIEPILMFVTRAQYRPRFDFYGVGRKAIEQNFAREYAEAFNREASR